MPGAKGEPKICIVGAGFSGLCAGIKLQTDLDLKNFVIYDENEDVGGTWLTHTYPGCACDVTSHVYSYSFELNPNWSISYARQPEILEYLKSVAAKHNLYSKIKFNHQVKATAWDDIIKKWRITVLDKITDSTSESICDILIGGIGGLRVPSIPEQYQNFKGEWMHSARWDHSIELENKTVAVIGSGCSAVQIVPEIAPKVKKLLSFQRRPAWVVPLTLYKFPTLIKKAFAAIPLIQWLFRVFLFFSQEMKYSAFKAKSVVTTAATWLGEWHLERQIPENKELQEKLHPSYRFGCKRVAPSNTFYKTLALPKCEVITDKIVEVRDNSIVTDDGKEYNIDVLILGTGYKVQEFWAPLQLIGRQSEDVLQEWQTHSPKHYLGITANTLPNFFMLLGPNTAYGHNSVIFSIECQVNWMVQVLREMMKRDSKVFSVKKTAENEYIKSLEERMKDTVWGTAECGSWYKDANGMVTALYPGSLVSYWRETRKANFADLEFD